MKTLSNLKHPIISAALLGSMIALLMIIPNDAAAQRNQDDVQEILDQTDEIIDRVAEIVMQSDSEQARRILQDAQRRQGQARDLHANGNSHFAIQMSIKAQDAARQAERIARTSNSYENRAFDLMDRLQETFDDIRQRAQDSNNELAMRFIREAEQTMRRAAEQSKQTRYDAAFTMLQTAERNLKRAARILFESGDSERLARELDNTAELLNRAAEAMGSSTDRALVEMLDQAKQTLDDARLAMNSGDPLRAIRLGRRSRDQAQRVLRQVDSNPDAESVQAQITRFDRQQAELADRIGDSANERAIDLLRQAKDLRDQAVAALESGNNQLALRKIRTAFGLQNRAGQRSG